MSSLWTEDDRSGHPWIAGRPHADAAATSTPAAAREDKPARVVRPAVPAAVAAAIAVARPEAVVAVPVERASMMLVTDTSGSMAASDVAPTRLDAVRDAVRGLLDDVPDELLVGFQSHASGTRASIAQSTARGEVRAALDALAASGGTATGDTLTTALDQRALAGSASRSTPSRSAPRRAS